MNKYICCGLILSVLLINGCIETSSNEIKSPTQLKYEIFEKFTDLFYCDPDFWPISREGAEKTNALEQFSDIENNTEEFQTILNYLNISEATTFTDEQKILIYREHKKLSYALKFEPFGDMYKFDIFVSQGFDGREIQGLITKTSEISITNIAESDNYCPICLSGDTKIDTPDGQIKVKDITKGMLVWTLDKNGNKVISPVMKTSTAPVSPSHKMSHIFLVNGRELWASPGHPTSDGRFIGELKKGDKIDNSEILKTDLVPYWDKYTYDILPSGDTGFYWANDILIGSTLK